MRGSSFLFAASVGFSRPKRAYDGLLLDAGGTLLQLARPVAETYASIGRKYGDPLVVLCRRKINDFAAKA